MDAQFWHEKWEKNQIAFHRQDFNPFLVDHFHRLGVAADGRIFVPLCGKTRDIQWLLGQGLRVVGAELSAIAVQQLFADLGEQPTVTDVGGLRRYQVQGLDIYLGDLFDLTAEILGRVDAVYDRAALVALPEAMRSRYAAHVTTITAGAPQLLVCYVYDQTQLDGPPFSVMPEDVTRYYGGHYRPTLILSEKIEGGLKGKCPAHEDLWLLKKI